MLAVLVVPRGEDLEEELSLWVDSLALAGDQRRHIVPQIREVSQEEVIALLDHSVVSVGRVEGGQLILFVVLTVTTVAYQLLAAHHVS